MMSYRREDGAVVHELAEHGQRKLPVTETGFPKRIEKISFGIMDSVEIMNSAEFQVFERALYKVRVLEVLWSPRLDIVSHHNHTD